MACGVCARSTRRAASLPGEGSTHLRGCGMTRRQKRTFGERSLNPLLRAKRSLPNAGHEAPLSSGPRLSRAQTGPSTLSPFAIF